LVIATTLRLLALDTRHQDRRVGGQRAARLQPGSAPGAAAPPRRDRGGMVVTSVIEEVVAVGLERALAVGDSEAAARSAPAPDRARARRRQQVERLHAQIGRPP
jgi:hypothetical protein